LGNAPLPELNPMQLEACVQIREGFKDSKTILLHGVTASGKTEVYIQLIAEALKQKGQILYLVPEIALTEQLIKRLQRVFGSQVAVFHSRQNQQERAELWHHVRLGASQARVILGARSALFLPFENLNLILVDEEHENTFKQFDPAPRYHARDAAIVLASYFGSNVLLGSATPSVESYYNTTTGKYLLVEMHRRYANVLLPDIELVDLTEFVKRKRMHGHFSERLRDAIAATLAAGSQVILFQNRRGYAPIVTCTSCGHSPHCIHCDVSLTYHQHRNELRCHYCGFHRELDITCEACGNATLDPRGFGTEQIEQELRELFPNAGVGRMDLDTTRGKYGYQNIIEAFEAKETDILVGTQMLTKGLDFRDVGLVGIMNADTLLNFPHFRAHERCFQLLTQVAGRAGRTKARGQVFIQTYNPYHQILKQVSTGDYLGMFREQVYERQQFNYPPRVRLIKITFTHREFNRVQEGSEWFARTLRQAYGEYVLGPEFPPVARVRNAYHKNILLKIPAGSALHTIKNSIKRIENSFNAISQFRSIRVFYNVDYI
jgi:primosomal protein N' (replication factor Y)